ncbi:Hypothetical predicted protein [Pelobates cultripes]|uniref:Uncharacterized protein n=1 Tax=Pelobates cultripes TaxID=61616 RepID=A0AAD1R3C5_PELCU|nr:Hypothetical predicted protein [Pelobates cultripes]
MAPKVTCSSESSEEFSLDEDLPDLLSKRVSPPQPLTPGDEAPSTKADIKALLKDIQAMFNADMELIRKEVITITDRVAAVEEDTGAIKVAQTATDSALHMMQKNQAALIAQVTAL